MQEITEQEILAMAPNASAASNGKKISQKGDFVRLECSADYTFYLGECTGSGKSNYITTADFIEPGTPVIRCSCPSRQFPCKHGLALLYEILNKKPFAECPIPEDILKKREKKQARDTKKENAAGKDTKKPGNKPVSKSGRGAQIKKLKRQLEGLELLEKLTRDLMKSGLGSMGGAALGVYRELKKQLGDYYLPGPQRLLNGLILEMEDFQKDGLEVHYEEALKILEKLRTLTKKSRQYLTERLENGEAVQDGSLLYEELGGVWKLAELEALGLYSEDVNLMQLAFWVVFDRARGEYIDTGCWADVDTGKVSMTYNYRPLKALKYVKQEDTVFGVARIPKAYYYPGESNPRVRWESAQIRPFTGDHLCSLRGLAAKALAPEIKKAKNQLKNASSVPVVYGLFSYARIGKAGEELALEDEAGGTILLGNAPGMEDTLSMLSMLPDASLLEHQTLLGGIYYDSAGRRIRMQPLSILAEKELVRLLY